MNGQIATSPVQVGLIGVGYWGARVAEAAKIAPEIRITHCYSRTEADPDSIRRPIWLSGRGQLPGDPGEPGDRRGPADHPEPQPP